MTSPETLELEAVDAALAGRYVAPEHAELAELALLLRDEPPAARARLGDAPRPASRGRLSSPAEAASRVALAAPGRTGGRDRRDRASRSSRSGH